MRRLLQLLAMVLVTGAALQRIAAQRDAGRFPAPGRLVDTGGRRLHLLGMGEDKPGPAVVLCAGLSGSSLEWETVQRSIAEFAPVFSYDRAGVGWSDPGDPYRRTGLHEIGTLRSVLRRAGVEPPYVLVGHSIGGLHARLFASCYPREVAGLVLVDSLHERMFEALPDAVWQREQVRRRALRLLPVLARFGIVRALVRLDVIPSLGGLFGRLPLANTPASRALYSSAEQWRGIVQQLDMLDATLSQVRRHADIRADLPLVVLQHSRRDAFAGWDSVTAAEAERVWHQLQAEVAARSAQAEHVVVPECGHFIHLEQPAAVIVTVRRVYEMASGRE